VPKNAPHLVFISHSHKDKELATQIKDELESRLSLQAFVAHEDIRPTQEWQETILEKLRECDVFLALLTKHFQKSNWTNQETGIAFSLHKIIIPIKIEVNPYGFISRLQALRWNRDNAEEGIDKMITLFYEREFISTAALIEGLGKSTSFADAGLKSELLQKIRRLSAKQVNQIAIAAVQNNQVYDSYKAKRVLRKLFTKYSDIIDPKVLKKVREHFVI